MRNRSRYLSYALGVFLAAGAGPLWAAEAQSIADAAKAHDNEAVRELVAGGGDVRATQYDGATALHWAAHFDELEIAELLIGAGADPNAANDYGATPLTVACTNANADMVEALLAAGADANARGLSGETPLMLCARTGNADAVSAIVAAGAEVNVSENDRGQTALMWAAAQKHPEAVRVLIEAGADVHARSHSGFSPLLFAARVGDLESSEALLAAGADIEASDEHGMTPLVMASVSGHEDLGIYFLDQGADPNARDEDGASALHYTVLMGITALNGIRYANYTDHIFRPSLNALAAALIERGAELNYRFERMPAVGGDRERVGIGASPLLLAAASPDPEMLRLFHEAGADPTLSTASNLTPLMAAAGLSRGQDYTEEEKVLALEAVRLLVEWGADVNAANDDGLTALHGAAVNGANGVVRYLVEHGATMDVWDHYQQTPLSIALGMRLPWIPYGDELGEIVQPHTAELLLELGATPVDSPGYFNPPGDDSDVYRINQGQRFERIGAPSDGSLPASPQPAR
jgi:ankyrin repeat protein